MTDTVNIYDTKTNLSKLVDRAAADFDGPLPPELQKYFE
jgi:hypothetical protein